LLALSVDKKRIEAGLPPLQTFVIDVISAAAAPLEVSDSAASELPPAIEIEKKMSSTQIRRWLAEHPPQERDA
jgi:pantetheine-phosphate adenylyltransferase